LVSVSIAGKLLGTLIGIEISSCPYFFS